MTDSSAMNRTDLIVNSTAGDLVALRIAETCRHYIATMEEFGAGHKYTDAALRLLRSEVGVEWRDMSAVPSDGIRVITYCPNAAAHGLRVLRENYRENGEWQKSNAYHWPPTHWTLMPSPPDELAKALDALKSAFFSTGGISPATTPNDPDRQQTTEESKTWLPIESAPKDREAFLALQDGEIYRAAIDDDGRLMFRIHRLFEPRTYQVVDAHLDGKSVKARVLIQEGPDEFRHDWCYWTRGFEFKPTHWIPLPPAPAVKPDKHQD